MQFFMNQKTYYSNQKCIIVSHRGWNASNIHVYSKTFIYCMIIQDAPCMLIYTLCVVMDVFSCIGCIFCMGPYKCDMVVVIKMSCIYAWPLLPVSANDAFVQLLCIQVTTTQRSNAAALCVKSLCGTCWGHAFQLHHYRIVGVPTEKSKVHKF